MLPDSPWDRLVLVRSSPGTGKTSLMRMFLPTTLEWIRARRNDKDIAPLRSTLLELGAFSEQRVRKLGVLLNLDQDYLSLLDLQVPSNVKRRLFLRLLDVRILVGVLRNSLVLHGKTFPDDVDALKIVPRYNGRVGAVLDRLGGPTGEGILGYARRTEQATIKVLDGLIASDVDAIPTGHNELYSLTLLADSLLTMAEKVIDAQPLIMFDDGHRLDSDQRDALLQQLRRRRPVIARWYAERFEALSKQELLAGVGQEHRDVVLVDLDRIARSGSRGRKRFSRRRYHQVLRDIARRRAAHYLSTYARESQGFLQLLDNDHDVPFGRVEREVLRQLEDRVVGMVGKDGRYTQWLNKARMGTGLEAAIRWRELEVLINRDQMRQQSFFEGELSTEQIRKRSNTAIREAAALDISQEFKTPYYAGEDMVLQLGSYNTHQFLNVCGDLFAEMLLDISLGRSPQLTMTSQDTGRSPGDNE